MAVLRYNKRKRMKSSSFALPKQRKYPIQDISHARNALARVAQFGTSSEKAKVRKAVHKKFPSINIKGMKRKVNIKKR